MILVELFEHIYNGGKGCVVSQIWLAVLEHTATGGPNPRHNVILCTVRGVQGKRDDPSPCCFTQFAEGHGIGDELGPVGRWVRDPSLGQERVVGKEGVGKVHDGDHIGRTFDF